MWARLMQCQSSTMGHGPQAGEGAAVLRSLAERGVVRDDGSRLEDDSRADGGVGAALDARRAELAATAAPDSRIIPGPMVAWAPILTPAPMTQSRRTAPGPTLTPSHRIAPSTRAFSAIRQPSPTTARGPTRAPASTSTPAPT